MYNKKEFSFEKPFTSSHYFTDKGFLKFDLHTQSFYEDNFVINVEYWFDEISSFEDSSKVLIKYLSENHHPHTTAIVTSTSCELLEGVKIISNVTDFIKD